MKRDPSLHITKSDLVKLLAEINYSQRTSGIALADKIFENAKKYQITDRYLQILEQKSAVKKKVTKSMEADDVPAGLVEKFNLWLVTERTAHNEYIKATPISKSNKQYTLLKEVVKMSQDFVEKFEITPQSDGHREYIRLGLRVMKRYSLNRFKTYDTLINEMFESSVIVLMDEHKEDTSKFYGIWQESMVKHTSMEGLDLLSDYVKYAHMVYGREQADECDAYYEDWVEAQFDGLSFMNVIPELSQFYGENAKKRWEKYIKQESGDFDKEETITELYGKD